MAASTACLLGALTGAAVGRPADPGRPAGGPGWPVHRTAGLVAGPVLGLSVYLLADTLDEGQRRLAGVLVFVVVYWVTEALPVPVSGLFGLALAVGLGVAPAADVFGSFASSTLFLFIGGFIIAEAMVCHGLHRRFAYQVLAWPGVAGSTYRVLLAFAAIAAVLSAFVTNTATAAMMCPIAIGVLQALGGPALGGPGRAGPGRSGAQARFASSLLLVVAFGVSAGGILTPVSSPSNLIGRGIIERETGVRIPFLAWVLHAVPIAAVMFAAVFGVVVALNRPRRRTLPGAAAHVRRARAELGPLSAGERNTLLALGLAVSLWLLPGLVGLATGDGSAVYRTVLARLDEGVVAIGAATLLFVLPVDWRSRRFTLTWQQAAAIDWGTIMLFGSGLAMAGLLADSGLAARLGAGIASGLGVRGELGVTVLAALIALVVSQTMSNTVSVGIVVPVVIPIAAAAGVGPALPALAAVFAVAYGFMLPVSAPPNAIAYGSGLVPVRRMVTAGATLGVVGGVVVVGTVLLLAAHTGLAGTGPIAARPAAPAPDPAPAPGGAAYRPPDLPQPRTGPGTEEPGAGSAPYAVPAATDD